MTNTITPRALVIYLGLIILLLFSPCFAAVEADKMADAEVSSWKAYYAKDKLGIFTNLTKMIGIQYDIQDPALLRQVSFQLGLAIAKFGELPRGTTTEEYDKQVLPLLVEGYKSLKDATNSKWNEEKAAKDDLAWWLARRRKGTNSPEQVGKLMAKLYRTVYGSEDNHHFSRAGFLRAAAARYRDLCKWHWGGIQEKDWAIIRTMLKDAYTELVMGIQLNDSKRVAVEAK